VPLELVAPVTALVLRCVEEVQQLPAGDVGTSRRSQGPHSLPTFDAGSGRRFRRSAEPPADSHIIRPIPWIWRHETTAGDVSRSAAIAIGDAESSLRRWSRGSRRLVNLLPTSRRWGSSTAAPAPGARADQPQKEGGQTKLLIAGPQIRKLLLMTKLDSVFEIHEDLEAAVSSF
jgi:hypothetical protein